jgi:hypothetical protein
MKSVARNLIDHPRIRILIAHKGFAENCVRCQRLIGEGEHYLLHSTDGRVHFKCLRAGQAKEFIEKAAV